MGASMPTGFCDHRPRGSGDHSRRLQSDARRRAQRIGNPLRCRGCRRRRAQRRTARRNSGGHGRTACARISGRRRTPLRIRGPDWPATRFPPRSRLSPIFRERRPEADLARSGAISATRSRRRRATMSSESSNVADVLRIQSRSSGDHRLLICDSERISYADADLLSGRLARGLIKSGAGKGSHVGLLYPNGVAFVVAMLAAARIGAVVAPFRHSPPRAKYASSSSTVTPNSSLPHRLFGPTTDARTAGRRVTGFPSRLR